MIEDMALMDFLTKQQDYDRGYGTNGFSLLKGAKYTWKKTDRHDIADRLDKFLISEDLNCRLADSLFRRTWTTVLET